MFKHVYPIILIQLRFATSPRLRQSKPGIPFKLELGVLERYLGLLGAEEYYTRHATLSGRLARLVEQVAVSSLR